VGLVVAADIGVCSVTDTYKGCKEDVGPRKRIGRCCVRMAAHLALRVPHVHCWQLCQRMDPSAAVRAGLGRQVAADMTMKQWSAVWLSTLSSAYLVNKTITQVKVVLDATFEGQPMSHIVGRFEDGSEVYMVYPVSVQDSLSPSNNQPHTPRTAPQSILTARRTVTFVFGPLPPSSCHPRYLSMSYSTHSKVLTFCTLQLHPINPAHTW